MVPTHPGSALWGGCPQRGAWGEEWPSLVALNHHMELAQAQEAGGAGNPPDTHPRGEPSPLHPHSQCPSLVLCHLTPSQKGIPDPPGFTPGQKSVHTWALPSTASEWGGGRSRAGSSHPKKRSVNCLGKLQPLLLMPREPCAAPPPDPALHKFPIYEMSYFMFLHGSPKSQFSLP